MNPQLEAEVRARLGGGGGIHGPPFLPMAGGAGMGFPQHMHMPMLTPQPMMMGQFPPPHMGGGGRGGRGGGGFVGPGGGGCRGARGGGGGGGGRGGGGGGRGRGGGGSGTVRGEAYVRPSMWEDPWAELMRTPPLAPAARQRGALVPALVPSQVVIPPPQVGSSLADMMEDSLHAAMRS